MYKHGAYGEIVSNPTEVTNKALNTIPVYFGTAPIGQVDGFDSINKPILLEDFNDAVTYIGYSDNWDKYTLCEAVYAHFKNKIKTIGPIVVVNCLDASTHKSVTEKTASVTFINKVSRFVDEDIILSSAQIEGKVRGQDYKITLDVDYKTIIVTDLKGDLSTATVTYSNVDSTMIIENDIIKSIQEGLPLVYQKHNLIPTILCAPAWSDKQRVNDALIESSQNINGHWYAWVNSDLPCGNEVDTIDKAISYKDDNYRNSPLQTQNWCKGINADKTYHLSVIHTVCMQQTDNTNDGVPCESPSNKDIDIHGLCLEDGTLIEFDKLQANKLNAKGITTATYWGGKWVLWGSTTAKFADGYAIEPKDIFSCSARMLQYIANVFQSRFGLVIDKPMDKRLADTIVNDFNDFLDDLVAQGRLLKGSISFKRKSNPDSNIILGDFVFDLQTTTTPPAKSLTLRVSYTSDGLSTLFG